MPKAMRILRFELNLKPWIELIRRWPRRQQQLFWVAVGLVLVLVLYYGILAPLAALGDKWEQELARQQQLLRQYQTLLANREAIKERLAAARKVLSQAEGQLLSGTSPAVAAADLQELIKKLTQEQGIQVVSIKVLPQREQGTYLEIPLGLQLAGRIDQFLGLLHQLEYNPKLLLVTEVEVMAPQRETKTGESPQLRINLVVSGLMKKGVGI